MTRILSKVYGAAAAFAILVHNPAHAFLNQAAMIAAGTTPTIQAPPLLSSFNPTANVTLSNGNRTGTNGTTTGDDIQINDALSITGISGKKVYYEMGCAAVNSPTGNGGAGYANQTNLPHWLGDNLSGNPSAGFVLGGNTNNFQAAGVYTQGAWGGCVAGDTMGLLLDATVSPMTLSVAVLHSGTWGAFSTARSLGSTGLTASGMLIPTADVKATGEAYTICGNTTCMASPTGLPSGAVWFDTLVPLPPPPVIASVTNFSGTSFAPATPNATVGNVIVTMNPASPGFTGSLSISSSNATTGHAGNACGFHLSGTTVQAGASGCLATGGPASNGVYDDWSLVATQAGISNSPYTQGESATATAAIVLLPADRDISANWKTAGFLGQPGGVIPTRSTQCGSTLNPIGGGADDSTNLQNAINACGTDQVLVLGSGTFTLSGATINLNRRMVIRGQGAGTTIIDRTNGALLGNSTVQSPTVPIFRMGGGTSTGAFQSLGSNAAKGDMGVTLASAPSGISAGSLVSVDELGLGQAMSDCCVGTGQGATVQVWAAPDYSYEWNAHNPVAPGGLDSACFDNSFQSNGNCTTPSGANHTDASGYSMRPGGVHEEYHLVTGVGTAACSSVVPGATANTICFDSPLALPYRTANSAAVVVFTSVVQYAGIENLTMQRGGDGNVQIQGCMYCWLKGIESYHYFNPGIHFEQGAFRNQLEHYWAHNGSWPINGGGGYSIALTFGASEIYIVDGISEKANKVIVMRASGSGSVVAYNYMDDGYIGTVPSETWVETGLNCSHMVGGGRALFEGNRTFNVDSDFTHGASTYCTYFRNHIAGIRAPFTGEFNGFFMDDTTGCCAPMRAAASHPYTYWTSFIGNVLGYSGMTGGGNPRGWVYSNNGSAGGNAGPPSMLKLGWDDFNTNPQSTKDDVANTIYPASASGSGPTFNTASVCNALADPCQTIVDGNYDYVQNQITWASNDTAHVLPNSLYVTSKPAFFTGGSSTWPPIDPITPTINNIPAYARWVACQPSPTASCIMTQP